MEHKININEDGTIEGYDNIQQLVEASEHLNCQTCIGCNESAFGCPLLFREA